MKRITLFLTLMGITSLLLPFVLDLDVLENIDPAGVTIAICGFQHSISYQAKG